MVRSIDGVLAWLCRCSWLRKLPISVITVVFIYRKAARASSYPLNVNSIKLIVVYIRSVNSGQAVPNEGRRTFIFKIHDCSCGSSLLSSGLLSRRKSLSFARRSRNARKRHARYDESSPRDQAKEGKPTYQIASLKKTSRS